MPPRRLALERLEGRAVPTAAPTTLPDPTPTAGDEFGYATAISDDGTVAAVSLRSDPLGNFNDAGAVEIYRQVNGAWQPSQLLTGAGVPNDAFGASLSLSADGSTLAVGVPNDGNTGRVYVFDTTITIMGGT